MPHSRPATARSRPSRRPRYAWETLSDEQLLSLRFCDLKLTLEGTDGCRRSGSRPMEYPASRYRFTSRTGV